MAIYYRFSGIVACVALLMNLVLIMAMMVLLNAPLTLPGLAGLVLTVGMSVDANVLIFERIREELQRGAALRMAIRNGFGRATTTIVDANVTTLITAMVLVCHRHRSDPRIRRDVDSGHLDEYVHGDLLFARRVRYRRTTALDHRIEDDAISRLDPAWTSSASGRLPSPGR